jgi:hypothetical protein
MLDTRFDRGDSSPSCCLPACRGLAETTGPSTAALARRRLAEKGLLPQWPEKGPPLLWTYANAGVGYSGAAVVGSRYYTLGGRGDAEFLIALDVDKVRDGAPAEAWAAKVGPLFDFKTNNWSSGPSSTPTSTATRSSPSAGTATSSAALSPADASAGASTCRPSWGPRSTRSAAAPRSSGGVSPGPRSSRATSSSACPGGPKGTVAALDKRSGKVVWRSAELTEQAAYTSPVAADIDKVRQILVLTNQGLRGRCGGQRKAALEVRPAPRHRGRELSDRQRLSGVHHGRGGRGGELIRVRREGDRFAVDEVYSNKNMANHHGNVVLLDGHLYGASEQRGWICQGFESGEGRLGRRARKTSERIRYLRRWSVLLFMERRTGSLTLVDASSKACNILARFVVPKKSERRKPAGGLWTPPVVANGRLFLRDQDLIFCYDVRASK